MTNDYKATVYSKHEPVLKLSRSFAKRNDADAWLTGARDMFRALGGSKLTYFELRDSEGTIIIAMRERGRKEH